MIDAESIPNRGEPASDLAKMIARATLVVVRGENGRMIKFQARKARTPARITATGVVMMDDEWTVMIDSEVWLRRRGSETPERFPSFEEAYRTVEALRLVPALS